MGQTKKILERKYLILVSSLFPSYLSVSIDINLADHIVELLRRGLLAEGVHHHAELLGADGPVSVLVKEGEGLPEFCGLLLCQVLSHLKKKILDYFLLKKYKYSIFVCPM